MAWAATAGALLDAAEAEFAESGIGDASLRAIMRAAGADPGSVHYHFRTREALAEAVLDRMLAPLNQRRLELLADAETQAPDGGVIPLHVLLDALIRPDIELAHSLEARSQGRARLVGAIYIRPVAFVTSRVEDHFRPVAQRFLPHLCAILPDVSRDTLSWRVRWYVFGVIGALLSDGAPLTDTRLSDIVAASAAAISVAQRD